MKYSLGGRVGKVVVFNNRPETDINDTKLSEEETDA